MAELASGQKSVMQWVLVDQFYGGLTSCATRKLCLHHQNVCKTIKTKRQLVLAMEMVL
jgi:hypothetical protein